jgi:hypothetical protein
MSGAGDVGLGGKKQKKRVKQWEGGDGGRGGGEVDFSSGAGGVAEGGGRGRGGEGVRGGGSGRLGIRQVWRVLQQLKLL